MTFAVDEIDTYGYFEDRERTIMHTLKVSIIVTTMCLTALTGLGAEAQDRYLPMADGLTYVGGCRWSTTADVAVQGDYAFLAMQYGLVVLDISTPASAVEVANLYVESSWTWDIEISGQYAFFLDYTGLTIIDISDPLSPSLVGRCAIPGNSGYDVEISGEYAYIAQKYDGVQIVDITTPLFPSLAGSVDTPGDARAVAIKDTLLYVADYSFGLKVINVADPYAPVIVGVNDFIGQACDVEVADSFAYIAARNDGLQIVSVADPQNPQIISGFDTFGRTDYLEVVDTLAYLSDADSGLLIVNIADPLAPSLVGSFPATGKVAAVDTFAYVSQWNDGITIVDVTEPAAPAPAGEFLTPGFGRDVIVVGTHGYSVRSNLDIIDVSDAHNPDPVGSLAVGAGADVAVVDTLAFVVGTDSAFTIVSVADPQTPYIVSIIDTVDYSYNVESNGDYAYVSTWQSGLVIINTTDPAAPFIEGRYPGFGHAYGLCLVGDLLYMGGMVVVNVANPQAPYQVGSYVACCSVPDVTVVDTLAYLAVGDSELMIGWLRIASVATLWNIYTVGNFGVSNEALGVAVAGDYAYLVDYAGLYAINVADPTNPVQAAVRGGPGFSGVTADGNYIYTAGQYGLLIFEMAISCGDANGDGSVNIGDAVFLINWIFKHGPAPNPPCKADAGGDGQLDIGDAVFLVNYVFRGGPAPGSNCCP